MNLSSSETISLGEKLEFSGHRLSLHTGEWDPGKPGRPHMKSGAPLSDGQLSEIFEDEKKLFEEALHMRKHLMKRLLARAKTAELDPDPQEKRRTLLASEEKDLRKELDKVIRPEDQGGIVKDFNWARSVAGRAGPTATEKEAQ